MYFNKNEINLSETSFSIYEKRKNSAHKCDRIYLQNS